MEERAARLGCVNRARPHRCTQRSATLAFAGAVHGMEILICTRCGWPILSYGAVVVVDDRDLDASVRAGFEAACDQLGIESQDRLRARCPRGHGRGEHAEVRAGFDERGRRWEENRKAITETFGNGNRLKEIVGSALRGAPEARPLSLADFGCGTGGLLARAMAVRGQGHFAGVDVSPVMIDRAAERLAASCRDQPRTTLDLVLGGAEATPLRAGSFDLVTAELALHHVVDPARVLSEMARVARIGGRVMVQVPGPGYSLDVNHGRGWKDSRIEPKTLPGNVDPLGRFGVDEVQRLAESAGLVPEHVDVDPWHYRFETAESCLAFLGRTGADARVRGYAAPLDLLASYGHVLEVGPLELRGEFVTLTASKAAATGTGRLRSHPIRAGSET